LLEIELRNPSAPVFVAADDGRLGDGSKRGTVLNVFSSVRQSKRLRQ
jgi:hypothetical protein